jgi:two-component system OmpR family sensor kinase
VVGNLITNALTHTPPGTPMTVTVGPDGAATVLFEVADQGPGMPPEHAARVFERFYRADASRARQTGGNGLGLAIVAAIVDAHSGTVEVRSAPGAGAVFRVRLPIHAGATPTAVGSGGDSHSAGGSGAVAPDTDLAAPASRTAE